ncbi:MAG TPA: hypothetical protein VK866_09200 [Acidimicrobiales bacterium]|nr:hypothetical protein [Acidimicrobiales bacterium]
MIDPVQLRLAVALAHVVPRAELRLTCHDGGRVVVGRHPSAHLSPCDLRRVVVAAELPGQPDVARWIERVEVAGVLVDGGGGVHLVDDADGRSAWFATTAPPYRVVDALEGAPTDDLPGVPDARVVLRPDPELGATVVQVSQDDGGSQHLHDLALRALGACLVIELEAATRRPSRRPRRAA